MQTPYSFSVLLAEDDHDDQFFLKNAMRQIDPSINLTIVGDGGQALNFFLNNNLVKSNYPQFIITDLNMPRMDGFEFLEKIKSNDALKHIPVFVLSTCGDESTVSRARKLGAADFYVKPLDLGQLKPIIESMIHKIKAS